MAKPICSDNAPRRRLAAFYRFDGLILVLQAFFDETLGGKSNFTAVDWLCL